MNMIFSPYRVVAPTYIFYHKHPKKSKGFPCYIGLFLFFFVNSSNKAASLGCAPGGIVNQYFRQIPLTKLG
jgi:hypothetical protein